MTDNQIHQRLVTLVKKERTLLSQIIGDLQLIHDQRIYASRGHSSLFQYMVSDLGYSEAAAYRRVNAVKIVKELPAISEQVKTGALNLNTLADATSAFRRSEKEHGEKLSSKEKSSVLSGLAGLSKRQAEKELAKRFPQNEPIRSKTRQFTTRNDPSVKTELTLVFTEQEMKVLGRLKELNPGKGVSELVLMSAESYLQKNDPIEKAKRAVTRKRVENAKTNPLPAKLLTIQSSSTKLSTTQSPSAKLSTKQSSSTKSLSTLLSPGKVGLKQITKSTPLAVPNAIRHAVWARDKGECQYVDAKTGRRCKSRVSVELDHIKPRALGGEHSIENSQLCCKTHNLYRARQVLGKSVMAPYWR